jgi:hypothetical protein
MINVEAILVGLLSVAHTPEQAEHAAKEVLRIHAHELAEQIRGFSWSSGCASGCCDDERGAEKAADLIDLATS